MFIFRQKMENRRNFLKTACKPIVLAALGIPILEACSTEEEEPMLMPPNSGAARTGPLVLDISDSAFSDLSEIGGWLNYTAENLLMVRISSSVMRVFDNRCPHQGNRDRWVYDGNEFTCQYHNNSYSNDCSGSLNCYQSTLEGNTLTISFD